MTTNHKDQSNRIMDALNENWVSQEGQTDATAIVTALDALRHATLAQVEATDALVAEAKALFVAQRTGNLIAYAVMNNLGGLPEATEMKSAIRQGLAIA